MRISVEFLNQKKTETWIKDIEIGLNKIPDAINAIGKEAHKYMQNFINSKSKRLQTGELAESINYEFKKFGKYIASVGIGKKDLLKKYWYVLNYGVRFDTKQPFVPPKSRGYFGMSDEPDKDDRGSGLGTDIWRTEKEGCFLNPTSSITPVRYIANTNLFINSIWKMKYSKKIKEIFIKRRKGWMK